MIKGFFQVALRLFSSTIFRLKNVPTPIEDSEVLSRYVFSSRYLKKDCTIHPAAFHPSPKDGLTSVFRKEKMSPEYEIKIIGMTEKGRGRPVVGKALISAYSIRSIRLEKHQLDVVPEESEHKWHADILNWPEEKALMKAIAQDLASKVIKE